MTILETHEKILKIKRIIEIILRKTYEHYENLRNPHENNENR